MKCNRCQDQISTGAHDPAYCTRPCLACGKAYREHDNSISGWGSCFKRTSKVQRVRRFGTCQGWCNGKTHAISDLTTHHKLPRRLGGSDSYENLVSLCQNCHYYTEGILKELQSDGCVRMPNIQEFHKIVRRIHKSVRKYNKELSRKSAA